ncbi:EGF-like repeat and discoidin I-like domain-containing protein 3 isoform X2 [Cynoglossus semilaevis]|uniref:EGF-like repeat and discoidin I-like domain-containing protein 3 isoform X2 n=1 Tax=Cynoglossus semilaevis TaxID=244447 RepID=UPI000497F858|nr:EGF-like repeat and discoidin I-like domain-containing protein 3 isoform X2 [Cynoglossus semilaevis]
MTRTGKVITAFVAASALLLCLHSVRGDYCEVNFCQNGGTCVTGVGEDPFICICVDGFGGDTCNLTDTGPCSPNPCKNDGLCEVITPTRRGDVFSEYICKCQSSFEGVHCQINVNDCAHQPCRNNGICRDLDGDFTCQCPSPYVGKKCQTRCTSLLGMEGGAIMESQISASSVHFGILGLQRWGPELARLNNQGMVNAWTSATHDRTPWIEINLQNKMRLTGIITQGASRMGSSECVRAFKVASSIDGRTYTTYRTDGQRHDKIFVGNTDNDSTKTNRFDPSIVAQYIRILPVVCRRACTLRMELVGCDLNGCSDALGMKSRLISDGQISATSSFRTWGIDAFTWHPRLARLDKQGKTNAWSPAHNNRSEWIEVDLDRTTRLTGIITQGAKDFGVVMFVSMFKVGYSNDGETWNTVKDEDTGKDKLFQGNIDNNSHKKNLFEPPFYARFVRVLPWEWHERIALRMELLGCDD